MKFKELLRNRRIQLIIIILVTILAYINILPNGFAWDDQDFFLDWPQIKNHEELPAYLSLPSLLQGDLPLGHRGVYRPIRSIYYLVSYSIWGKNPFGYHFQAIIIHLLIVVVIYLITELITKKRPIALITSALFATHPIHTEAVTYTTASMDTLGILFFFLSFYLYIKSEGEKQKKGIYLVASLIYGFLAFLTYEMTLVLPFIIVLYNFCTNKFSFKKLISKITNYKYFFLLLVIYLLIRFVVLGIGNRADYLGSAWAIAANQARIGMPEIFINYLWWLIWPANLTISHEVPINLLLGFLKLLNIIDSSGNLEILSARVAFLFPIFFALSSTSLIYFFFKKYPLIFFSISWIIISLLPVSSIIPQGAVITERFLYIPSFGFIFLLSLLFYYGFLTFKKKGAYRPLSYILLALLLVTLALYTYQTIKRNQEWRDGKSIWQSAIKNNPKNPLPYGALGLVYISTGQYETGINLLNKNIELTEPSPSTYSRLGLAYEKDGEIEKAIAQHQKALKMDPQYYHAHTYLGNIYLTHNQYDLAEEEYQKALAIHKNDPLILSNLGDTYFNQKKYDKSLDFYQQALDIDSHSHLLLTKIGSTYLKISKYDQAIEAFDKSLELNPRQPDIYIIMADSYKKRGEIQTAKKILEKGLTILPNNTNLQDALKLQ